MGVTQKHNENDKIRIPAECKISFKNNILKDQGLEKFTLTWYNNAILMT